jgi:predicted peptidase
MEPLRQTAHTFRLQIELSHLLYLPPGYEDGGDWPLVLFLHGVGERGQDLELVKLQGIPSLIEQGQDFPFVVVAPQCPDGATWRPVELAALLDDVQERYRIDPDRVYVTGISMGGFGTWSLIVAHPHRFAAAAPICGGGDPEAVGAVAHLPVWAFHGARDPLVPLRSSAEMVDALLARGGNARLTVYPEAGHNSWVEAYGEPELYGWLLAQRRQGA